MTTDKQIEKHITNIFITIDNYGTNEEARVDIRKLIHEERERAVAQAHKTADGWCCACGADQAFMQAEIDRAVQKALHKVYLCAIGKYSGDPLENVLAELKAKLKEKE